MNKEIKELVRVNEQIERLAEESGCKIDSLGYGEGNLEKFAELVEKATVEKCIEAANKQKSVATPPHIDTKSFNMGVDYVVQSLNSNFRIG